MKSTSIRLSVLAGLLTACAYANAQESKPFFGKGNFGLFGGIRNEYTVPTRNGKNFYSLGGEFGVVLNRKWYLGTYNLYSMTPLNSVSQPDTPDDRLRYAQFGVSAHYRIGSARSVGILVGARAGYAFWSQDNKRVNSNATISPELSLEVPINRWLRATGGSNYRFNLEQTKESFVVNDFNGPNIHVGLTAHLF
jgi:hypothetical protein